MMRRKAVVLLSGGLDSAATLYFAKKQGYDCHCLIFDYGQRHRREIESAKKIAAAAGCRWRQLKISLPWKGSSLLDRKSTICHSTGALRGVYTEQSECVQGQALRPKNLKERFFALDTKCQGRRVTSSEQIYIPNTYVPARNIIFLSFALSYAEAIGACAIFIGANAVDFSGYPDCRAGFYQDFQKAARSGTKAGTEGKPIRIITPLINKAKAQIIRLGMRLDVPYELTWSCYKGGRRPCGECDSCLFRAKGFREAGFKDPLLGIFDQL